jgi:hypothetical protein
MMSLITSSLDAILYINSLEALTEAVKSSFQKSLWWDLIVPLILAGFVAGSTAFITYMFTKRLNNIAIAANKAQQEEHYTNTLLIERENMNRESINELLLLANSCLTSLIAIKDNYRKCLGTSLSKRLLDVPFIKAARFDEISYPMLSRLFFITPSEGEEVLKWGQVTEIEGLLSNYNCLMSIWQERNLMREQYQDMLTHANVREVYNLKEIEKHVSNVFVQNFIQLTEYCLNLTDNICREFNDLLLNFNKAYSTKLNSDVSKELLIRICGFTEEGLSMRKPLFKPGPPPNFDQIKDKFPSPEEFKLFVGMCQSD